MAIFSLSLDDDFPDVCRGGAITLGNFDGVHRGHQALLTEAIRQARSASGAAIAITFDPHPLQLLKPDLFQPVLTGMAYRTELLQDFGVDHVLVLKTCRELLQLGAREFFDRILRAKLNARAIVEGPNFGFGRGREGTIETLKSLGEAADVQVAIVPPFELAGVIVSSSRVRREIEAGRVAQAREMLNRPYRVAGIVGVGQRRGNQLGFPTANLDNITTILPADGVYAARANVGEKSFAAAVNIGPNPTFGEQARKVEAHLLEFRGDLYGHPLTLDFLQRLRDTRLFADVPELVKQLQADVVQTRSLVEFAPHSR